MYQNNMGEIGKYKILPAESSTIGAANSSVTSEKIFPAGNQSDSSSWTGMLSLLSPLSSQQTVVAEIGYSTNTMGDNFVTTGPFYSITGNDVDKYFLLPFSESQCALSPGHYLSLRLTNSSTADISLKVGASSSFVSAPEESDNTDIIANLASLEVKYLDGKYKFIGKQKAKLVLQDFLYGDHYQKVPIIIKL